MTQKDSKIVIDPLPGHVAIIMDGNGRWARARGLPRTAGHKKGADTVKKIIEGAGELGIQYLTLFAFSSENWSRPEAEVSDLMGLLKYYLKSELSVLHKNNIRLKIVGDTNAFSKDIQKLLTEAENLTADNTALNLNIALNYGGRCEITNATRKIADLVAGGIIEPGDITKDTVAAHLMTAGTPDPDLLIRTSGELRISNFLLWQCAYSEFWFTDKFWPDFGCEDLVAACQAYAGRERRFGEVVNQKGSGEPSTAEAM